MSDHDDSARSDSLGAFLREVQRLMDEERFRGLAEAGVGIMVPDEVTRSSRGGRFEARAEAAAPCNCPPGMRCIRVFPGGDRMCVSKHD